MYFEYMQIALMSVKNDFATSLQTTCSCYGTTRLPYSHLLLLLQLKFMKMLLKMLPENLDPNMASSVPHNVGVMIKILAFLRTKNLMSLYDHFV